MIKTENQTKYTVGKSDVATATMDGITPASTYRTLKPRDAAQLAAVLITWLDSIGAITSASTEMDWDSGRAVSISQLMEVDNCPTDEAIDGSIAQHDRVRGA